MYVLKSEWKSGKPERKRFASYFILKIERKHHAVFYLALWHHPRRGRNQVGKCVTSHFPNPNIHVVRHASNFRYNDKIHLPVRPPFQPHRASEILWCTPDTGVILRVKVPCGDATFLLGVI
jgi:hypothetical protein